MVGGLFHHRRRNDRAEETVRTFPVQLPWHTFSKGGLTFALQAVSAPTPTQQLPSQDPPFPTQRFGLTEVHVPPPEGVIADIVLVHGLNGNPQKTWTSSNGVFWPKDLLPRDVQDRARILLYGYDADVASLGGTGASKDMIHNHAEALVQNLVANRRREHASERPIIFVAHSLGGLVVKRALTYSCAITGAKTERLRSVYVSTYGILFLGTPHHGSDVAVWGTYLERLSHAVMPRKLIDTAPQLVEALKVNSETLHNIDRQFAQIMARFHIYFFHEGKPMDFKGTLRFVVTEDSAAPTMPDVERAVIQADHSQMTKYDSVNAPGYDLVSEAIDYYIEEAGLSQLILQRWEDEKKRSQAAKLALQRELLGPDMTPPQLVSEGTTPAGPTPSTSLAFPMQQRLPAPEAVSGRYVEYVVEDLEYEHA